MLTLAALRVLLLRNGIFPAVYFQLIVSPSRFLQLSQHRFLWSRRKIDHIWRHRQSSGGKTPFLVCVCGPHCSVHKISRTHSSLSVAPDGWALRHIAYLALVLEVGPFQLWRLTPWWWWWWGGRFCQRTRVTGRLHCTPLLKKPFHWQHGWNSRTFGSVNIFLYLLDLEIYWLRGVQVCWRSVHTPSQRAPAHIPCMLNARL